MLGGGGHKKCPLFKGGGVGGGVQNVLPCLEGGGGWGGGCKN